MKSFIFRVLTVLAFGVLIVFLLQTAMSPGSENKFELKLEVSVSADSSKDFIFTASDTGLCRIGGQQVPYGRLVRRLQDIAGQAQIKASGESGSWSADITAGGVSIDGKASSMDELLELINSKALPVGFAPTKAVTVMDVLAANLPMPTKSRVSFPNFSFEDAFPGDTYSKIMPDGIGDDELIVIDSFSQSPILSGEAEIPDKYIPHLPKPEDLPPVEDRLPINPAVVVGPDSPGNYSPSRSWHRVSTAVRDWWSKMSAESFVRFDPSGRIQPNLAYRWEVEDGNRMYTFYLRKGQKWSNGTPFTAHDIAFVCNTVIGSSYWANSPNWMLETNGFSALYPQDVLDWPALAKALTDTENSPLAAHLANITNGDLLKTLKEIAQTSKVDRLQGEIVINELNSLFREPKFFNPELFSKLDLESDVAELDKIGYSKLNKDDKYRLYTLLERNDLRTRALAVAPDRLGDLLKSSELTKLNLLMFRASLRDEIAPAKREKVKVEALADDVIRFTFPRPNSIFLEKTATYMFYRGLFMMSEDFYAPFLPECSDQLDTIDIYNWQSFTAMISDAADAGETSAIGRLWQRTDEETRKLLKSYPVDDRTLTDEIQQNRKSIINGINSALSSRDYYEPQAWDGIDLNKRWNELTSVGMSLVNSRTIRYQTKELMFIHDLIKRYNANAADLSDQEIIKMNTMLLREALGPAAGIEDEIIAVNREAALDKAAQAHPNAYSTWITRAQRVRQDERTWEDHVPVISAWYPITLERERDFWIVRNPYYYKVDQKGQQLPYIDGVLTTKETNKSNIQLSMSAGNVDFQARDLTFDNYTYLKSKEKAGNYELRLWANDFVGEVNFYFGQVHKDPVIRELFNDRRFRQAMSLALDRQEIIDIAFMGLSEPAQFSVPKGSPYYSEKLAKAFVERDMDRANKLLDELGLDKRNKEGIRLRPDGRPMKLNLDAQEWLPLPVMMLASQHWRKIGVDVVLQIRRGTLIDRMLQIGLLDIGAAKEGGNYSGPLQPGGFAPTHEAECPQWQQWVKFIRSYGRTGESPPAWLMRINGMWTDVIESTNEQDKFAAWQKLCDWSAEDCSRIGITTSPGKLVYVKNDFKNVPKIAMAGWIAHEPANSCPEAFYFVDTDNQKSSEENALAK